MHAGQGYRVGGLSLKVVAGADVVFTEVLYWRAPKLEMHRALAHHIVAHVLSSRAECPDAPGKCYRVTSSVGPTDMSECYMLAVGRFKGLLARGRCSNLTPEDAAKGKEQESAMPE